MNDYINIAVISDNYLIQIMETGKYVKNVCLLTKLQIMEIATLLFYTLLLRVLRNVEWPVILILFKSFYLNTSHSFKQKSYVKRINTYHELLLPHFLHFLFNQ